MSTMEIMPLDDGALGLRPPLDSPLAIVMVGLPARGKTYTAQKVARYLSWLGYACEVFNVGNYRRSCFGAQVPASFFDPDNPSGVESRRQAALRGLDDMVDWSRNRGGQIGIYDATNSTRSRRKLVARRLSEAGLNVLFLESICSDGRLIEENIRATKLRSPDYAGVEEEAAVSDFRARIAHYERAYEPIEDTELRFIKLIDTGRQLVLNRTRGYVEGRVVNLLMNLHLLPRSIWLTRHGQSQANVGGRIGGDEELSDAGQAFADRLARWTSERTGGGPCVVWTSTLQRTIQTGQKLGRPTLQQKGLDEIHAGICDGMTYDEIRQAMPDEWEARAADKLRYRYPRGESYQDVIRRLDPLLLELERQHEPTLVIAHQAILRALFGYFTGAALATVPHLSIPLHTVIELRPQAYGCAVELHELGPSIAAHA